MDAPAIQSKQAGLPRYYHITALMVMIMLTLAGGLIYWRLAVDALIEQVEGDHAAFAGRIHLLAVRAVNGRDVRDELLEEAEAEMSERPIILVRVIDRTYRIRFSTNPSEIGQRSTDERLPTYYGAESSLDHYDSIDTGEQVLRNRYLLRTRNGWWDNSRWTVTEMFSDVTTPLRTIILGDVLATGGLTLALAAALVVVLRRRQ